MAEMGQLHEDPRVDAAMRDTLELYDVYICSGCRLIAGRNKPHECQVPPTRRDEYE